MTGSDPCLLSIMNGSDVAMHLACGRVGNDDFAGEPCSLKLEIDCAADVLR